MKKVPAYWIAAVLIVCMFFMTFVGFSYQESSKIAFIETQKIIDEYDEFVEAAEKIDAEQAKYEEEFQGMQDDFVQKREEFDKQQMLLSEERQQQMRQELDRLYRDINSYGQMHFGPEGTIAKLSAELNDPILEKVRGVIQKIGIDLEYDYILDGTTEVILYAKSAHDITPLVMKELEK